MEKEETKELELKVLGNVLELLGKLVDKVEKIDKKLDSISTDIGKLKWII